MLWRNSVHVSTLNQSLPYDHIPEWSTVHTQAPVFRPRCGNPHDTGQQCLLAIYARIDKLT